MVGLIDVCGDELAERRVRVLSLTLANKRFLQRKLGSRIQEIPT
jgi:hypothetical protein